MQENKKLKITVILVAILLIAVVAIVVAILNNKEEIDTGSGNKILSKEQIDTGNDGKDTRQ